MDAPERSEHVPWVTVVAAKLHGSLSAFKVAQTAIAIGVLVAIVAQIANKRAVAQRRIQLTAAHAAERARLEAPARRLDAIDNHVTRLARDPFEPIPYASTHLDKV